MKFIIGVGGLALDVLTLGTIGLFGRAASTAVKEGAKQGTKAAVKTGAQQVFKIAVTEMLKEGFVALAQTAVTQAARRAVESIAEHVDNN